MVPCSYSGADVVEVECLVKRHRGTPHDAVDSVSFAVSAGEFFALLGPNGAGKTITISILTTTLAPTSGRVRIAGVDVRRDSAAVRKEIGTTPAGRTFCYSIVLRYTLERVRTEAAGIGRARRRLARGPTI
jgi:ABC-type multidrug transport system ATPase subunit